MSSTTIDGLRTDTVNEQPPTPADVAAAVVALRRALDDRHAELDEQCRVPADLYDELVQLGLFRQLVPQELGGAGLTPLDWFDNGVELAAGDASVGWVVTQGAAELGWIGTAGDPDWAADVLADPRAASASTIAGAGTLTVDGERALLDGRWAFDTGCHGATWIGGLATVLPAADGAEPEFRFSWVPADRAEIIDDWNPAGLRGTGSSSIVIEQQEIPLAWTIDVAQPTSNDRGPYRVLVGNGNWTIASSVAAVQLGASRRALEETRAVLERKRDDTGTLARNPGIQVDYMEAEARWHAAHALMQRELASMWELAERRGQLDDAQRMNLKFATINANRTAVDVIGVVTRLTGTTTVDPSHPLTRSARDVLALQGHIGTSRRSIEFAAEYHFGIRDDLVHHV